MKNIRLLTFVLIIATLALSACGTPVATPKPAEPTQAATSVKVNAMPVAFLGVVERMDGDQWVISGNKVTVDPSIVRDGPFNVGDRVKVEGFTSSDGSFTLSRVEAPSPQETATQPPAMDDNSNDSNVNDDNSNAVNSNDDNSNAANTNDDHGGSVNVNDDNSNSANSNDNSGSSQNSNDDHGGKSNNDNSGKGSDDKGGNSNGG